MVVKTTQTDQHTWVLGFSGKLNFHSRQAYQQAVNQAEEASARLIVLDFTELSYIDSAALGLLTLTHRKLTTKGNRMIIANPQGSVRDILLLTNMDKMFSIVNSVAAASQK